MDGWGDVEGALDGLVDVATVRSTSITGGYSVLARLRGTEGEGEAHEEADGCEVWGVAGVQSRPKASSASGACEVLFLRQHDELLGFASRDLRYQVTVAEGELAIHALGKDGATQAVVRCKPDGTVVVEGSSIQLGAGATQAFIRGTEFLAALTTFAAALAADGTNPAVAAAGATLQAYLNAGTAASTIVKGL